MLLFCQPTAVFGFRFRAYAAYRPRRPVIPTSPSPTPVAPCLIMHMPPMMCVLFPFIFACPQPVPTLSHLPLLPVLCMYSHVLAHPMCCHYLFSTDSFFSLSLSLMPYSGAIKNNCQKNITQSPHYSRLLCMVWYGMVCARSKAY